MSGNPGGPAGPTDQNERLRERIAELEQALRVRDEFLAIAAHELRNPMHSLLLQVSAAVQVARKQDHEPLLRRLERVQQIVDRYVKRASLLLDIGRMNAQGPQPQLEPLDFAEVVREVLESYAPEAAFNRCPLRPSLPQSLPGRWDRLALEQVVSNLISNAIKFGAGQPIEVSLRREDDQHVCFAVRDRGIGIAPADQERIFGRFERLSSPVRHPAGAGVGLWLVRRLVEAHGGHIRVSSTRGQGAAFSVDLPLDVGTTRD